MSGDFSSFWKDDFHCLRQAGKWITQNLRNDETNADLYKRIETGQDNLSGLYFEGDENRVRHIGSQTLPTMIRSAIQSAQANVRMGLAAAARIAWVIVDSHVYLWSFDRREACISIASEKGQYIIAVELVAPTTDAFGEHVEWCVVMTTYDTVYLDVLIRYESSEYLPHGPSGSLRHARTDFRIPTDGVQLAAVVGTQKGRIFLGGDRGQLVEMVPILVDNSKQEKQVLDHLETFYDGDEDIPSILREVVVFGKKRKRSDAPPTPPKRKSRKVTYERSLVHAVVPNAVLNALPLGSSKGGLSKLLVDEDRNLLYGLTAGGYLLAWKLGTGNGATPFNSEGFNVEDAAAKYLQYLSRGQNPRMGCAFSFIGSIACARAGVGGSEGALSIIKANERANSSNEPVKPLKPTGIHIIRPTESMSLSLLVVTASGLRLYISAERSILMLRHIRAPPPTQEAQVFADEVRGMKPATSIPGLIASSCYSKGTFVAASTVIGRPGEVPVTRVVVTSHDDRYKEISNSDGTRSPGKVRGLSESAVWPLQGGFPAGLVHDMAALPSQPKPLDYLMSHSSTPTEAELSLPLTPAFSPFGSGTSNQFAKQGGSTALTKPKPNIVMFGSMFMSTLFGTSMNNTHYRGGDGAGTSHFRVSKRFGSHGFSSSAADTKSKKILTSSASAARSNSTKSMCPRLRQCFLHPQVKPMRDLAKQCFETSTTMAMLNTSGVHFFELETVLSGLTKYFASAASSEGRAITDHFTTYGDEEGCSLCLGLVVGIGEASSLATVGERAKNAAYQNGSVPSLQPIQTGSTASDGATTSGDDELVPEGYEFRASSLCTGMSLLVARLVRPIWNKPVVVVTEGRKITRLLGSSMNTPAKVELLLNDRVAKELWDHLKSFERTIREMFAPAINTVPGVTTSSSEMDIDDVMGDNLLLSGALQYNRNLLAMNNTDVALNGAERQERARLLEEKNIHSIYRLVSRLNQLVSLLNYLGLHCTNESSSGLNPEWGLLHGLTIAQLVETSEGQDRLETLVDNLLTQPPSGRGTRNIEELASFVQTDCFFFVSPSSRDAFKGFRSAERAASLVRSSSDFIAARQEARTNFLAAARNWHSPAIVVGKNSPRAKSPLVEAARTLVNLGDVVGAVEVCFTTASNFQQRLNDHTNFVTTYAITSDGEHYRWQDGLYHKRRGSSVNRDQQSSYRPESLSRRSPDSNRVAYGQTEATAQDAIEKCHEVIFKHLSDLLLVDNELGLQMLSRALLHHDEFYLHSLFSFLFDNGFKQTLYSIEEERSLVDWLEKKKSSRDLFDYLMLQGQFERAGAHAYDVARTPEDVPLVFRIDWLNRAVSSYKRIAGGFAHPYHPKVQPLTKELNWANLQLRIVEKLDSLPEGEGRPDETQIQKLRNQIATPQVLFEDYAANYGLHEECLYILHACAENEQGVIEKLWRHILRLTVFPCATSNSDTYSKLSQFAETADLSDMLLFANPGHTPPVPMFESLEWAKKIREVTVRLGVDLYGTGADFVFPVKFLLTQLEALRRAQTPTGTGPVLSPGWSLVVLADSGVPFMEVWKSISNDNRQNRFLLDGCDADGTIENIGSVCELVEYWLSKVTSDRVADDELSKAKQTGAVSTHIAELRDRLLPLAPYAQSRLSSRLDEIETKLELHYFGRR